MKNLKICLPGCAFALTLLLTACGHNAVNYGDGVGFDVGINPENYTLSLNLRYGKILSAVTRDNAELELTGKTTADGNADEKKAGVTTDGSLKIRIGRQINGAAVDLVKAGADPEKVLEILTDKEAVKTENKENEEK